MTLRDGTQVVLRQVRPADKVLLVKGLEKLSPESRYRRFLMPKSKLSERELAYLTEVDGHDHFALGAVRVNPDGTEEGLGVARFVRMPGEPKVAEAAIAVIDEMQGKGLGRILLRELTEAAVARGVTHFRSLLLADNAPMRALLEDIADGPVRAHVSAAALEIDVPICPDVSAPSPPAGEPAPPTPVERLLAAAAAGALTVMRLFGLPED